MTGLDISHYAGVMKQALAVIKGQEEPPPFNLPIPHWSPSSLGMFQRCPYQWQQRYVHGRKERPAEAPFVGTAVHSGLEQNFRQKIESHVDLPTVELLSWYDDEGFLKTLASEMERAGEEVMWQTSPEEAKARGRSMIAGYHQQVSPRIQPIGVEGKVEIDFGLAVPVEGRYDLLEERRCVDWKTGKRSQKKPKESWRIQAAVYGEATGRPVEFHSVTATERGAVTIVTPLESEQLLVNPTEREREVMRTSLRAISHTACMFMEIFGPDEPWPTHGRFHDWACDYCGFRPTCPAWEE